MAKIANKSEGCLNILFFSRKKVTILLKKKVEEKFLNPEFSSVVFFWSDSQLKVHVHLKHVWSFLVFFHKLDFMVKKIVWQDFSNLSESESDLIHQKKAQVISFLDKKVVKQFMLREQIEKREDIFFYFLQRNNISFEKIVRLIIGKVCDLVFLFFENKRFFQKMKADLDLLIKIFFNKNFSILENFSFWSFHENIKKINNLSKEFNFKLEKK